MSEQDKKKVDEQENLLDEISEEELAQASGGTEKGWKGFKKDFVAVEKVVVKDVIPIAVKLIK
jgi:hypothetical protein